MFDNSLEGAVMDKDMMSMYLYNSLWVVLCTAVSL